MDNVLGYYVYDSEARQWLAEDEVSWANSFHSAASFASFDLANDAMTRTGGDYVFACMPSA